MLKKKKGKGIRKTKKNKWTSIVSWHFCKRNRNWFVCVGKKTWNLVHIFVKTYLSELGYTSLIGNFSYTSTQKIPLQRKYLVWQDFLVFGVSLSLPLMIGVFFLITSCRKKSSADDFLVGERSINFVAVALSLLGSLLNGIFVIGTPAEIRYFGARFVYVVIGLLLAVTIVSIIFVPKYQGMKFTSAYEVRFRFSAAIDTKSKQYYLKVRIYLMTRWSILN